ncbi:hypothetical protein D9M73_240020 [compost metagenome]
MMRAPEHLEKPRAHLARPDQGTQAHSNGQRIPLPLQQGQQMNRHRRHDHRTHGKGRGQQQVDPTIHRAIPTLPSIALGQYPAATRQHPQVQRRHADQQQDGIALARRAPTELFDGQRYHRPAQRGRET